MKRLMIGLLLALLTACGLPVPKSDAEHLNHITTANGLECVVYHDGYRGGVSCNWDAYNKQHER